jgi:hypothetical protein
MGTHSGGCSFCTRSGEDLAELKMPLCPQCQGCRDCCEHIRKVYTFRVRERHGERENDFEVTIADTTLREAIIGAVAEVVFFHIDDDNEEGTPRERAAVLIARECGDDWTAEGYFEGTTPAFWDGGDGGSSLFSIYAPYRITTEDDTPSTVMLRCVERYYEQGMFEKLRGLLRTVLEELDDSEVERIFYEDIHTQRELEGKETVTNG